jgi:hypothetical protein
MTTTIIDELAAQRSPALAAYCKNPVKIDHQVRKAIAAAWGNQCSFCPGGRVEQVDHIVPKAKGGADAPENYAPSCTACNRKKSDALLHAPAVSLLLTQAQSKARKIRASLETNRAKTKKDLMAKLARLLAEYAQFFIGDQTSAPDLASRLLDYWCGHMGVVDLRSATKKMERKLKICRRELGEKKLDRFDAGCLTANLLLMVKDIREETIADRIPSKEIVWVCLYSSQDVQDSLLSALEDCTTIGIDGKFHILSGGMGEIDCILRRSGDWLRTSPSLDREISLRVDHVDNTLRVDPFVMDALRICKRIGFCSFSYDSRWLGEHKIPAAPEVVWPGHHMHPATAFIQNFDFWGADVEILRDKLYDYFSLDEEGDEAINTIIWQVAYMVNDDIHHFQKKRQEAHENEFLAKSCLLISKLAPFMDATRLSARFRNSEIYDMICKIRSMDLQADHAADVDEVLHHYYNAESAIESIEILENMTKSVIGPFDPFYGRFCENVSNSQELARL